MNQGFEENINSIIAIMKKRIKIVYVLTIVLIIISIILTIFLFKKYYYLVLVYFITLLTYLIKYLFIYNIIKLQGLLDNYQNDPSEVIDYLLIIIKNCDYNQFNFIMKTYYKKIIPYYISALDELKR